MYDKSRAPHSNGLRCPFAWVQPHTVEVPHADANGPRWLPRDPRTDDDGDDANPKFTEIALEPNADGKPRCQGDYELSVQPVAAQSQGACLQAQICSGPAYFADGEDDLGFQFCGTTQRQTVWNRSCEDTIKYLNGLGVNFPQPKVAGTPSLAVDGYQSPSSPSRPPATRRQRSTGARWVEPRSPYSRKCAGGFQCNSADVCVRSANPPQNITYLSWW